MGPLQRLRSLFSAVLSLFIPTPPPPLWAGRIYLWSKSQRIQIVIGGYGRTPFRNSTSARTLLTGRFRDKRALIVGYAANVRDDVPTTRIFKADDGATKPRRAR